MLNNNFRNWVIGVIGRINSSSYPIKNLKDVNGEIQDLSTGAPSDTSLSLVTGFENITFENFADRRSSLFVGTGQKEESMEDFKLESIIPDSDLTYVSINVNFVDGKHVFTRTFAYIGTNDITVTEVAFYKSVQYKGTPVCLARQVIEPIPVKTGDTFTVTMVIG